MIQYINEDIEVLKSARIHQHKDIVVVYKKPTALTALKKINDLTGLHTVKERIHELQKFNAINQLKKKKGIATPNVTMHLVFTGNPGTGKTTVARILGEVYHSIGLLDSGQTIMVNALDLLAKYVGQTAPKVEETFNHALGGVLFIDEAYALKQTSGGYGEEAIAKLIQLMEENRNDVMVIMAGYEKEMMDFLQMNPGLRERFTEIIHFEDYNKEELKTIYIQMLKEQNYGLTEGALLKLDVIIEKLLNHGKFKSNARSIRNMVDKTFINQSVRLHDAVIFPKDAFLTITAEDIPSSFD
jgi:SpoVK/Ycf46/Vps4 family AAA+-type ATPase